MNKQNQTNTALDVDQLHKLKRVEAMVLTVIEAIKGLDMAETTPLNSVLTDAADLIFDVIETAEQSDSSPQWQAVIDVEEPAALVQ